MINLTELEKAARNQGCLKKNGDINWNAISERTGVASAILYRIRNNPSYAASLPTLQKLVAGLRISLNKLVQQ